MANIVVTKVGKSVIVETNDYEPILGFVKASYHQDHLALVQIREDHVWVYESSVNEEWPLTSNQDYQGQDFLIVDSVDGVAPTSEEDLFNKISALR